MNRILIKKGSNISITIKKLNYLNLTDRNAAMQKTKARNYFSD